MHAVGFHPLCKFTWGPLLCAMVSGNARRYAAAIPACLQLPGLDLGTLSSCKPAVIYEIDSVDICSLIIFCDPRKLSKIWSQSSWVSGCMQTMIEQWLNKWNFSHEIISVFMPDSWVNIPSTDKCMIKLHSHGPTHIIRLHVLRRSFGLWCFDAETWWGKKHLEGVALQTGGAPLPRHHPKMWWAASIWDQPLNNGTMPSRSGIESVATRTFWWGVTMKLVKKKWGMWRQQLTIAGSTMQSCYRCCNWCQKMVFSYPQFRVS